MENKMLRYGAVVLLGICATALQAQNISLSAPSMAGRDAKVYYFTGAKVDSLLSTIDNAGKANFTLLSGDYRGMVALVVPEVGGIELVVAEPSIEVECSSAELNTETVVFKNSSENDFLNRVFTSKSKYMQQQAWLQAGGELFGDDSPLAKQLRPELKKTEDSIAALDREITASSLYSARYYRLVDFMNRLFDTEQKRDVDGATLIRKEMEENLYIAALYISGRLWGSVLNFYISLFNHTAERPDRRFDYPQIAAELKERVNGDIWLVGGDEMIGSLLENGLVDELTVNVLPLTLGNGRPLFSRNRLEQDWKLKEIEGYDNGALRMSYVLK